MSSNTSLAALRAAIARASKTYGSAAPETVEARRLYSATLAEDWLTRWAASWPAPTPEQATRLVTLIRPCADRVDGAA